MSSSPTSFNKKFRNKAARYWLQNKTLKSRESHRKKTDFDEKTHQSKTIVDKRAANLFPSGNPKLHMQVGLLHANTHLWLCNILGQDNLLSLISQQISSNAGLFPIQVKTWLRKPLILKHFYFFQKN